MVWSTASRIAAIDFVSDFAISQNLAVLSKFMFDLKLALLHSSVSKCAGKFAISDRLGGPGPSICEESP